MIDKAGKKMDTLTKRILKADSDLAEVVKKYQRPSQLCLNITLILMVLALVGVIITLIRGQTVWYYFNFHFCLYNTYLIVKKSYSHLYNQ